MDYFRFGLRLAFSFFIVGTVILLLFFLNSSVRGALIAYEFTIVAIVANWLYALFLLFLFLRRKISLPTLIKTLGVMAINIPVGILYSYLMLWILSYARITIENNSGAKIGSVAFHGCQSKSVADLEDGKSETVWIKIERECDIAIMYRINEQENKRDTIIHGVRPGKGVQIKYQLK